MRYPASEKAEIIRLVEQSHLPVKQTLQKLGIPRTTFYRWCDLLQLDGIDALEDHRPLPGHVWNHVPDSIRQEIVSLALEEQTLLPRELAVKIGVVNDITRLTFRVCSLKLNAWRCVAENTVLFCPCSCLTVLRHRSKSLQHLEARLAQR
jgi:transposase-like protein